MDILSEVSESVPVTDNYSSGSSEIKPHAIACGLVTWWALLFTLSYGGIPHSIWTPIVTVIEACTASLLAALLVFIIFVVAKACTAMAWTYIGNKFGRRASEHND